MTPPQSDKQYNELFQDTLETVCGQRRMAENAWPEEQEEFAHQIMAILADAYDAGFTQAEYEADGFPGVSGWINRNPYRPTKKVDK